MRFIKPMHKISTHFAASSFYSTWICLRSWYHCNFKGLAWTTIRSTMQEDTHIQGPNEGYRHDAKYSDFTKAQKRWIVLLVAFAGMFSPLSSFIYYPAIKTIASDLSVTITLVNLTVTSYMIVSGITPAIVGDLADMVGRRPIYLVTFLIYFVANIGLALQKSYPALLVLRMLTKRWRLW